MDRRTMELRSRMLGFLDECRESTHSPVNDETQEKIQAAVDSIGDARGDGGMTPGQEQALEAIGETIDQVEFTDESELSPGQRAARSI